MIRHLAFVLLLAAGIALANDRPEAQRASGAAAAQAKPEAAQGRKERAKAQVDKDPKAQIDKDATVLTEKDPKAPTGKDAPAQTDKDAKVQTDEGAKLVSVPGGKALGMSILANQEAPTSLVIVPWKSSELGASPGVSPMLDDSRQPVDKEVFMRALRYYDIRSEKKP